MTRLILVYVDTNAMAGRAGDYDADTERWTNIVYMPTTAENDFTPALPDAPVDLIYLCSPNNPTGTVLSREALQRWVDFANATDAVILFDAAYERFIADPAIPHSIYEIPGAKTCAIEFRSFSKTAGFTGARCGYTVVPRDLVREGQSLNAMWNRRQTTKFNGASYVIQRGAAAIYTPEGAAQVDETIDFYRANARTIKEGLAEAGLRYGADNSPCRVVPHFNGTGSWDFFNRLLEEANVITTPRCRFGPAGEGWPHPPDSPSATQTTRAKPSSASSGCSMPRVATSRSAPRNRRSSRWARAVADACQQSLHN